MERVVYKHGLIIISQRLKGEITHLKEEQAITETAYYKVDLPGYHMLSAKLADHTDPYPVLVGE